MKVAYLRQAWRPCEHFSFFFSSQSRSFAEWYMEVLCIAGRTSRGEPTLRPGLLSCLGTPLMLGWWEACSRPGLGFLAQCHILQHSVTLPALPALSFPSLLSCYKCLKPQTLPMVLLLKIQKWHLWFNTIPLGRDFPHCWPELHLVHVWFSMDSFTFPGI